MWLCAYGIPDGLKCVLRLAICIYTDQYVIYYATMFGIRGFKHVMCVDMLL